MRITVRFKVSDQGKGLRVRAKNISGYGYNLGLRVKVNVSGKG